VGGEGKSYFSKPMGNKNLSVMFGGTVIKDEIVKEEEQCLLRVHLPFLNVIRKKGEAIPPTLDLTLDRVWKKETTLLGTENGNQEGDKITTCWRKRRH